MPWLPPAERAAGWAHVVAAVLTLEPLLATLAHAQQTLDTHDVEGVYPIYQALAATTAGGTVAVEEGLRQRTPAQVEAYVAAAVRGDESGPWGILRRYLVGATLKDCSVLLALALAEEDEQQPMGSVSMRQQVEARGHCTVMVAGRAVAVTYQLRGT